MKNNDTLYGIANKNETSILEIMNKNNLNNTNLIVGQKILI
ncbi:MAG: LysM peptidoglycan-binding domain-containing protein [Clostridia bacterium]|nr:LysM peptidoglycan-binding domain-containing protein [Clostridia bacterium]MDD4376096.1 LysM peptidoglycan-binding domain-containing protein [Clostridia bacterium]